MFRPTLGHHQVVLTRLRILYVKSRFFIVMKRSHSSYIFLGNLLGLKLVGLVVLGFGCGVVERIGRCCILYCIIFRFV